MSTPCHFCGKPRDVNHDYRECAKFLDGIVRIGMNEGRYVPPFIARSAVDHEKVRDIALKGVRGTVQ